VKSKENAVNASDVMASQVITTGPESAVRDVAALLIEKRISAVPVVDDDGKLIGIVSEGDLLRRSEIDTERRRSWWLAWVTSSESLAAAFVRTHSRRVGDVMTRKVVTAEPDTPLHQVATLLEQNRIKRVPIVKDGALTGIVSRADLVRALASSREDAPPPSHDDAALYDTIMANLDAEPWARTAFINITARSGLIELKGLVESETQRDAVRVAIEITPGVTAVNDHLMIRPATAES
jgi:CBS domain-containing protein